MLVIIIMSFITLIINYFFSTVGTLNTKHEIHKVIIIKYYL